jgi:hypothetical protein
MKFWVETRSPLFVARENSLLSVSRAFFGSTQVIPSVLSAITQRGEGDLWRDGQLGLRGQRVLPCVRGSHAFWRDDVY